MEDFFFTWINPVVLLRLLRTNTNQSTLIFYNVTKLKFVMESMFNSADMNRFLCVLCLWPIAT